MTLEEIDQRFPNGFDDAQITGLTVDFQKRSVSLEMRIRANSPDAANCDEYSRAILTALGFYYFSIEPPDVDHLENRWPQITVNGYPEDPANFPLFDHLKSALPLSVFCCRLYVHDWNSFIHLAAKEAQVSLVEEVVEE